MTDVTIDEWFFYYLTDKDENKYILAYNIFNKMYEKCDRMVFLKDSPVNEKLNLLSRFDLPKQRNIIKNFFRMFGYNSEKLLLIEEAVEIPEEIVDSLPKKEKDKDKFLVRTCLSTADKVIITADDELKKAIDGKHGIKVRIVKEFWEDYKNA